LKQEQMLFPTRNQTLKEVLRTLMQELLSKIKNLDKKPMSMS